MITSLQNPLVKQMRKLHRAKERREQNLFLLEGTHLLEAACEVGFTLATLCFTPQWQQRYPQLWENASRLAKRAEVVTPEVLEAIATTVHPDGVLATATRLLEKSPSLTHWHLGLLLECLQDPGNLGTLIRTAAATEIDGIWLSEDSVELDNPKVLRSSAGAWFRVPLAVTSNLSDLVKSYQRQGVQVIATRSQAARTYWQVDFTRPTLILLGNEGAGLSAELLSLADQTVSIPLAGNVESLNVAIAAALLLYEAKRQHAIFYVNFDKVV